MTLVYQGYLIYQNHFDWIDMLLSPSPMSWFIYALVIWYAGYYFSFKIGRTVKEKLGLVWLFTLVYLAFTIYLKQPYYYISILPLPMAITYVFYEEKLKAVIIEHAICVWWIVMAIVLVVMGYAVAGQYGMNLPGWAPPVNVLVPWVIVYITYYLGGLKNKAVLFLGSLSYEFYIVHGFIVMQLGNVRIMNVGEAVRKPVGIANRLIEAGFSSLMPVIAV